MANIPKEFVAMRLKLASPDDILRWSYGEVKKPETINYRTQRPEKDGLFCERIFGPTKDWECYCGKYKRIRYKGIVCDKCGVEVTRSIVRRERMGHIKLASPVSHIWFLKGVPSKVGLILDLSAQALEKVVYFASYIITFVDEGAKEEVLKQLEDEYKSSTKEIKAKYQQEIGEIKKVKADRLAAGENKKKVEADTEKKIGKVYEKREGEISELNQLFSKSKKEVADLKKKKIISELEYRDLSLKYGQVFRAGIGAEAVQEILEEIDLGELVKELRALIAESNVAQRKKLKRRLNLIEGMIKAEIDPSWMITTVLPVIPPDLRPMVQLDGGRFAASDLNDLYRRVINRNNRLKRLLELNAPEVICRNEKRMLQEAVDALIDNSARHGKAVAASTGQKRVLRSLADMLRGKQGRFRQNLLGKRVDYSGRSVIVIGPHLKLNECGIPKTMALELFKPFVINKLIENEYAHNVRSVSRLIEEDRPEVWDMLEEVIQDHYVLLNRAPTLHRLGIQAFQPVLIEGKAIKIHPMVCSAFNADFDGDQMAVHVPLTDGARQEAMEIMSSSRNLLKPATGDPITVATQDIVLGCYYISDMVEGGLGEGKIFASPKEAFLAYDVRKVGLKAKIKVRLPKEGVVETCVGRLVFNQLLPVDFGFVNETLDKKTLSKTISAILNRFGSEETVEFVDQLKKVGFEYLTRAGMSWGMDDLVLPKEKKELLKEAEAKVEEIRQQYKAGLLTDEERYLKIIETWAGVKDKVTQISSKTLDSHGPVYSMVESGARGSWPQIVQMMGMRGLMAAPSGRTIELPVRDSFKEGLGVLEYFISTHGARKGLSDTALRTANAGYLTRRLVDVSQDVVIHEEDCGDKAGVLMTAKESEDLNEKLPDRILGRVAAEEIIDPKSKKVIVPANEVIGFEELRKIEKAGIAEVRVRSVLTCKSLRGICQKCYGWDLGMNRMADVGQAVGIVAAQSIGEPGTQLTMRTFHTGGVAGEGDITQGLPRVEELFEVRGIKSPAVVTEIDGVVHVEEEKERKLIRVISKDKEEKKYKWDISEAKVKVKKGEEVERGKVIFVNKDGEKIKAEVEGTVKLTKKNLELVGVGALEKIYEVPSNAVVWYQTGDEVEAGQQLSEGHVDLKELFRIGGRDAVQKYILKEVQFIYSSQGQDVNDKHFEIIIRQMLSKVRIKKSGGTKLLVGDIVERVTFEEAFKEAKKEKQELPEAEDLLLGITKASLSTESFLSAASFQETSKVLIEAAVAAKVDKLRGLKENVIIGKMIPAGTGFRKIK